MATGNTEKQTSLFRKPLKCGVDFLKNWLRSRNYWQLAAAIPALLFSIAILLLAIRNRNVDEHSIIQNYQKASYAAIENGDHEQAEVLLKRLLVLQPNEPSTKYRLAICAEASGNSFRARSMMNRIAPTTSTGYPPAHFWLAKKFTDQNNFNSEDQRSRRILEHHLISAAKDPNYSDLANHYLSQLYIGKGNYKKAVSAYKKIKQRGPKYFQTLSQLYVAAGESAQAENAARSGLRDLLGRIKENPKSLQLYFLAAQTAVALQEFEQAISLLKTGLVQTQSALKTAQSNTQKEDQPGKRTDLAKKADRIQEEQRRFMTAIAITYCVWFDATPKGRLDERLELIDNALKYGPNVKRVLAGLAELSTEADKDAKRFESLHEAIVNGTAPATVHRILGTHALENDEFRKAEQHFRMAISHQPYSVKTLNNLAWCLSHKEDPDLDGALEFAKRAVRLAPKDYRIIDTRAEIFVLMDDKNAAIRDYEEILKLNPEHLETCKRLANLYAQVGLDDLAKQFEAKVEELIAREDT